MKQLFLTLLVLVTIASLAQAQSDLPNEKKAVFCLDVRVNKLLQSKLAESLGKDMIQEISKSMKLPVPAEKYVRILGLMGAPDTIEDLERMRPNRGLPFNMLFEFQMSDADSAEELFQVMDLDRESGREINGVEYFSPPALAPQNIIAGLADEKTVVLGTKDFVLANSRKDLLSEELQKVWKKHQSSSPVRASLEMVTKAELVSEAVAIGGKQVPRTFAPFISLLDNFESINLALDLSGEELLTLRGIGKNDDDAAELREGLDSLLGIAKLASGPMLAELKEAPKAKVMVKAVLNDLKTAGDDREVNVVIGRPAEMEPAAAELLVLLKKQAEVVTRQNNLRQVVLAVLNYEAAHLNFPFEADESEPSWRTAVSPFMTFDDEEVMPKVFGTDGKNSMIAHVRTENLVKGIAEIADGSSNTICLVEVKEGIPWKKNQDITPEQLVKLIKSLKEGEVIFAARYDGSVLTLDSKTDLEKLKAMCTPDGGEVIRN